jgi:hypothetical protein
VIDLAKKRSNNRTSSRKKSSSVRKTSGNNRTNNKQTSKDMAAIAKAVLTGEGKNPYYYRDVSIQNFHELLDYLQQFSEHEAGWLADWIDYLGDNQTAVRIRDTPSEFKTIIDNRYQELKRTIKE